MKIKLSLLIVFLLSSAFTTAQTRTGTGPDVHKDGLIQDFLISINEKSSECIGEKKDFKNLSEFKLYYTYEQTLEKSDPLCEEGAIPKKYLCLFDGKAKSDLNRFVKSEKLIEEMAYHTAKNKLSEAERASILKLLLELNRKFSHDEKN
jgi:hypothetical protein